MKKVWYVTTDELGSICDGWIKDNPHNNGYAHRWIVEDPDDSAYPDMEKYFIVMGANIGETVIVHSVW